MNKNADAERRMRVSHSAGGFSSRRVRQPATHKRTDICNEGIRLEISRRRETRGGTGTSSLWVDDATSPARARVLGSANSSAMLVGDFVRHRDGAHGIFTSTSVPPDAKHILQDPAMAQRFLEKRREDRRRAVEELVPKKWKTLELLSSRLCVLNVSKSCFHIGK